MGGKRLSGSRAAPAVTVEVTGMTVTHQEVAVISLSKFECANTFPKYVAGVMAMIAAMTLVTPLPAQAV